MYLLPAGTELVDAHVHLDLYRDSEKILAEAKVHRINLIAVTNAPSVFFHTHEISKSNPNVRAAVGLHPELVHSHERELESLWPHLAVTQFVGEIGLDYSTPDEKLRERQRRVFSAVIKRCGDKGGKVISVHSRRAAKDVIAAIGPHYTGSVILHWFSGSPRELEDAVQIGCFFSVNPAMVISQSGQRLIKMMPRDRVLTETDGPFVQVAGQPTTPANIWDALHGIAKVWGTDAIQVAQQVWKNFVSLPYAHL